MYFCVCHFGLGLHCKKIIVKLNKISVFLKSVTINLEEHALVQAQLSRINRATLRAMEKYCHAQKVCALPFILPVELSSCFIT